MNLDIPTTEKKKPAPKKKQDNALSLEERIDRIERALILVSHHSGNDNQLKKAGFKLEELYTPNAKDMRKYN